MAKYTVTLHELIESNFDFGLKDYPIWDEAHRDELNQKILDHYRFREIGFETPGRFKFELNNKLNEIMPYYIKLYETTKYEYNPIHNVDYTEENTTNKDSTGNVKNNEIGTSKGEGTVEGNSSSSSSADSKMIEVDTPQSRVNEIVNGTAKPYASSVDVNTNKGEATSEDKSTTTSESTLTNNYESDSKHNEVETFNKRLKGNYGVTTSQTMIKQEREIIINIDMKIVYELNELFMLVF